MKKKYLFFDIDGTLSVTSYGGTFIPESTKLALKKLREAGHFTAISTGRSQAMAEAIRKELGFANMVSDGGYGITLNHELVGITPLNKEHVVDLVRECEEKGYPWGLQLTNETKRQVPDQRFYESTNDYYLPCEVVEGLNPEDHEKIYKAYVACAPGEEEKIEALKKLPWCRFQPEYIFVEPCDKAFGIRKVMEHYNADCEDVVVFGDAMNDITMFIDDWTCVAMGNACDEIKERADLITDDVDKNGIYNACEKLGLFEPVEA